MLIMIYYYDIMIDITVDPRGEARIKWYNPPKQHQTHVRRIHPRIYDIKHICILYEF